MGQPLRLMRLQGRYKNQAHGEGRVGSHEPEKEVMEEEDRLS